MDASGGVRREYLLAGMRVVWPIAARREPRPPVSYPQSVSIPFEVMNLALIGPCGGVGGQAVAGGITADVVPFFSILLPTADRRIPMIGLPDNRRLNRLVSPGELRFPITHPTIEVDRRVDVDGKIMNVVRHNDVPADTPCRRVLPCSTQKTMDVFAGQHRPPVLGADGVEDDRGTASRFKNPMRGMFAAIGRVRLPPNPGCGGRCRGLFVVHRRKVCGDGCRLADQLGGSLALPEPRRPR